MEKKWDVYVYGDVNIDLVVPGVSSLPRPGEEDEVESMETFVGGGAALFAMGLGRLGLHPVFQGSVGDDLYGAYIRSKFRELGIDETLLTTDTKKKTGISLSFTNEKDRCFLTYRGTNEGISADKLRLDQVKAARHVHVTGYAGRARHTLYRELLAQLKTLGDVTVSFDVGWDCTGEWCEEICELFPCIDVLFMNETEALHYSRMATAREAAFSFAQKAGIAVIKRGKEGALAVKDGEMVEMPGFLVKAIDPTGAGDSFNAGFIYGFLSGMEIQACLACANACGALSVTGLGGNSAFPSRKEMEEFVAARTGQALSGQESF